MNIQPENTEKPGEYSHQTVNDVSELIEQQSFDEVEERLENLELDDRNRVISRLAGTAKQELVSNVSTEQATDIIHELPEVLAVELLDEIQPATAAGILKGLPKDEQADLVGELPPQSMDAILSEMPSLEASQIRSLVEYDDEEAGGIMVVEFLAFNSKQTVSGVIDHLRQNVETISDFDVQYAYVVDGDHRLKGVLRLRDLLLSLGETRLSDVMIKNPHSVDVHTSLQELYALFQDHRYLGIPVVDGEQRLVGIVTREHVDEAVADRYAEDFRKTQGIVKEELRTMPLMLRSRRRLAWLSINILLNILAASIIAMFQDTLTQVIALAVFLPIISDMSGCSGNQAVAVSMRELSLGLVNAKEVFRVWMKELSVGLINGIALGLLIATVASIWQGNPMLGAVVGLAMMVNTVVAVSIGGTLPLIMRLFKLDPALASGPILTTITDMCGFLLVLGLASIFLEYLV